MGDKRFRGIGNHDPNAKTSDVGFGYAGEVTGGNNSYLAAGLGLYNGENLDVLQANGQLGVWETTGQTPGAQIGVKGEAQTIGLQASLGDIVGGIGSLFGQDWASDDQQESNLGGWENFLSGEVHGPEAKGEISAGSDGIYFGGTAELYGGSAKIGGAEYDWFGGTELTFGGGAGGVGLDAGLISTDEDGDGITEWGFRLGGELGIGAGFGMKTELPGHIANGASAAWDWATDTAAPAIGNAWDTSTDWIGNTASDIGSGISSGWDSATDWAGSTASDIGSGISSGWDSVTDWAGSTASDIGSGISSGWDSATDWAGSTASDIGSGISSGWNSATDWAGDTASDIGSGISSGWNSATDWAGDTASNVGGAVASFFSGW